MPSAARSATAKKSRANLNAGAEPCANPDDAAEYSTRAGQDGVVTKKQGGTVVEAGVMSGWAASVMESLAEALGELGPIDEGAVAPRQAPSANDAAAIKKVRVAVMTALRKKDLPGLAALLASKVDVNFMAKKGLGWQSPLGLAVQHNWLDGVLALVDAGARESLARARNVAEEPAAATDGQAQKKEPWRWIHSDKIFKALVESEDDPEELKKLAKNMIGDVDKALILLRAGKERIGSVELWDSVEHAATENIRARIALHGSAPLEEPAAQTLMALWEQWPERLSVPFDARWETAVRLDQPRMLATLAKGRAAPPKNWEIALRADDIDGAWWERAENLRAQGLSAPSTKVFCDIREGFAGNTRVDLWTFAVAAAAPRCVEALGRVKPLLLRARQGWSNTGHLALFVCSKGTPKKSTRVARGPEPRDGPGGLRGHKRRESTARPLPKSRVRKRRHHGNGSIASGMDQRKGVGGKNAI